MRLKQRKQLYLLIEGLPMEEIKQARKKKLKYIYCICKQRQGKERERERESKEEKRMVNYIYQKAKNNGSK